MYCPYHVARVRVRVLGANGALTRDSRLAVPLRGSARTRPRTHAAQTRHSCARARHRDGRGDGRGDGGGELGELTSWRAGGLESSFKNIFP